MTLTQNLIDLNNIRKFEFKEWALYPGMLFNSPEKWWGNGGVRKTLHEGIDLCFYKDSIGQTHCLKETAIIPVMYDGEVVKIHDDFLGKSIYVGHDIYDETGNQLFSIYGHTEPASDMKRGRLLNEGDIIGSISDIRNRNIGLPSHLHISIAWLSEKIQYKDINWVTINNKSLATMMDPFDFIECDYTVFTETVFQKY